MTLETAKSGKLLYHLTELDNLESIIQNELLPRKIMIDNELLFIDIADTEIINKRQVLGLDVYTPFHFHPYSAFDVAVKKQHTDKKFIYLCLTRMIAKDNDFKIITSHPMNFETRNFIMYDYDDGMNQIDWEAMKTYGNDDDYIKHVKMAECLTEKSVQIEALQCIYVESEEIKNHILGLFRQYNIQSNPPYVNVMPSWFN